VIGHWLGSFFSWPNGSVWGNAVVAVPGFVTHHLLIKKHISRKVNATPQKQEAAR